MATFGVGRAASNDLMLRPAVSACHAQLVRGGGSGGDGGGSGDSGGGSGEAWRVSDLGSSTAPVCGSRERTPSRAFRLLPGHALMLGLGPGGASCRFLGVGVNRL